MNNQLNIYDLSTVINHPNFCQTWDDLVHNFGDVYYEIPYLQVANLNEEGQIFLCLYENDAGFVLYSFVLRPLERLSFAHNIAQAKYDIITPFEYGGPLIITNQEKDRSYLQLSFNQAFTNYCLSQGIVTEFVRFHPLLALHQAWHSYYQLRHSCIHPIIDLNKSSETIWSEYTKNNRRDIKLALKRGVKIEKSAKNFTDINNFTSIYYPTMDKYQAKLFYYFSADYFQSLATLNNDLASLYLAKDNQDHPIGGAWFLHGQKFSHYHLSGSLITNLCPMNLLLHTVILDLQKAGKKYLHLLGSPASQPSLLEFKNKFSSDRIDYYVGTRVYNEKIYQELGAAWAKANPEKAVNPPVNFFPLYRA